VIEIVDSDERSCKNVIEEQGKKTRESLQSLFKQSYGDYASMFLIELAEGRSINDFLNRFKKNEFVENNHKVGQMLKCWIVHELTWCKICKTPCRQDTYGSSGGVHHSKACSHKRVFIF